jgi:SNF2 family DNA or RNA helicase
VRSYCRPGDRGTAQVGRGNSASLADDDLLHFFPVPLSSKPVKRGRGQRDESDEDAELLRDEEDDGERAGHRLQFQPQIITGGTLREYQMQGLNWLIHLYDNGINGILADEMVGACRGAHPCMLA